MIFSLLKKYTPNEVRWMLLSHHYRNSWEFFQKDLENARVNICLIKKVLNRKTKNLNTAKNIYLKEFQKIMDNDLNISNALKLVSELARIALKEKNKDCFEAKLALRQIIDVLGFNL